jgi:hypothetical protein
MGQNFNKFLYILIGVIIILIIIVKFFFKRDIPITDIPLDKRKQHRAFLKKTIPLVVKSKIQSNNIIKKNIKKNRFISKSTAAVDFISKGVAYSFSGRQGKQGYEVNTIETNKTGVFTGSFMIKAKSKQSVINMIKKYNLKITKSFEHINYFYVSTIKKEELSEVKNKINNLLANNTYFSIEPEILFRPVKVK